MEKQNREKILEKVDELVSLLKNNSDYQRYLYLSNEMKKNDSIMKLIKDIKTLEKKRVNLEDRKESTKEIDAEIDNRKQELNEYPTYVEYNYLLEDLNNTFQSIRSILEQNINQ